MRLLSIITFFLGIFFIAARSVSAGAVSGTLAGPHGETGRFDYSFVRSDPPTTEWGTTEKDGSFSQLLEEGNWQFVATPPASLSFTDRSVISSIPLGTDQNYDLGLLRFPFVSSASSHATALPPQCTAPPGEPVIIRAFYEDETKGSYLYATRSAAIIVVADKPDYTVWGDYSLLENLPLGTASSAGVLKGETGTTYRIDYALKNPQPTFGFPIISVSNGVSTSYVCLEPGPTNLDIRSPFRGLQTTDFTHPLVDFRAVQNFTIHQEDLFKLVFHKPLNFRDPEVQTWVASLSAKLIAGKGKIDLDAGAVPEIQQSGASVSLYGLTNYLSTPTVLLNGYEGGSDISSVEFDTEKGILSFDVSHFSEYRAVPKIEAPNLLNNIVTTNTTITIDGMVNDPTATVKILNGVEDQGVIGVSAHGRFQKKVPLVYGKNSIVISASNAIGAAPELTRIITLVPPRQPCTEAMQPPAPVVMKVARDGTTVTLSFIASEGKVSDYLILYGLTSADERFGDFFSTSQKTGIIEHTIGSLSSSETYYFKIRAANTCAAGPWSAIQESKPARIAPPVELLKTVSAVQLANGSVEGASDAVYRLPRRKEYDKYEDTFSPPDKPKDIRSVTGWWERFVAWLKEGIGFEE
ncbi:hypothetical protein HGA88_01380 [Candidatus Roizmanbacteria bacterium]|nr:hypothetical protein [Candidatus Roizmanbacteria bacterium]